MKSPNTGCARMKDLDGIPMCANCFYFKPSEREPEYRGECRYDYMATPENTHPLSPNMYAHTSKCVRIWESVDRDSITLSRKAIEDMYPKKWIVTKEGDPNVRDVVVWNLGDLLKRVKKCSLCGEYHPPQHLTLVKQPFEENWAKGAEFEGILCPRCLDEQREASEDEGFRMYEEEGW